MAMLDMISPDEIRAAFSRAMSVMYREEVPLYSELLDVVAQVNREYLEHHPASAPRFSGEDLDRIASERHGAIRLGKASELAMIRRVLAVMGMYAVGYYDLSAAGVPVHSTAFRPITPQGLTSSPFRLFTSLLRLDLVEDRTLREEAGEILEAREIFPDKVKQLVIQSERDGGLNPEGAASFVTALMETFRWHGDAPVSRRQYARFHDVHRLIADVVCFRGPHINHLTPRTLDIDAAQAEMARRGMCTKAVIEGPPRRDVPILLRQTSFRALEESIMFTGEDGDQRGAHSARFGEIEQRGVALTPTGRLLYDRLLGEVWGVTSEAPEYAELLTDTFRQFPDNEGQLRRGGLAYFHYSITPEDAARCRVDHPQASIDWLVDAGLIVCTPITYEDFLPVSAAGIFRSNLGGQDQRSCFSSAAQCAFEQALGAQVIGPFDLYNEQETASIRAVERALGRTSAV